ncbi:hypothetical protein TNCV_3914401 [Trichonephila clavipes]|nr:hypothetical protein TNCV_3914401 [Trichonephila clavipes]
MLLQFVDKLDPSIFLSTLIESGFLSVFILYQIIDDVTVIECFVFNQMRAAGALRESIWMRIVGGWFITNEQSILKCLHFSGVTYTPASREGQDSKNLRLD